MYDRTRVETIEYHRSMLTDKARMQGYLRAILHTVEPGDVVLDIGSGTGILAYFACMAGAKRVYAVEQDPVIELARAICNHNGFQDRVVFLNEWSDQVELPEPVDVLVTETIGNIGFEEGILGWVIDAKKRLLAPGGRIIPGSLELFAVPIEISEEFALLNDWTKEIYTLDFAPVRAMLTNNLLWIKLHPKMFLSQPVSVIQKELADIESSDIAGECMFVARRDGTVQGLGCWFKVELVPDISISNGPPLETPSWTQILLPLERPVAVSAGDQLHVQIQSSANGARWDWFVSNGHIAGSECVQSTLSGQLLSQTDEGDLMRQPVRNLDGELELLVLAMMDGSATVEEITWRAMVRFPLQFSSFEDMLFLVQQVIKNYGHSPNGQSPTSGVAYEEMRSELKIKIKEV